MNRNRLLHEIKQQLIRMFRKDYYKLKQVIPYYVLIQKENHPLLLELIKETNNKKFYIDYDYNYNEVYHGSYGKLIIRFSKEVINETYEIEEYNDDDDFPERYLQKEGTYFEINLSYYTNASADYECPRITIRKCIESDFIFGGEDISEEYKNWNTEIELEYLQSKFDWLK